MSSVPDAAAPAWSAPVFIVLSVAGLIVTGIGMNEIGMPAGETHKHVFWLLAVFLVIEFLDRFCHLARARTYLVLLAAAAVMANAIWPVLPVLLFALSSYLVGQVVTRMLGLDHHQLPPVMMLLVGACAYALTIGLLAHYPVNYPGTYAFMLLAPVLARIRAAGDVLRDMGDRVLAYEARPVLDTLIVLLLSVHFAVALMPEVGHDALAMHLFIPGQVFHRHEWGFDASTYVWAVMPMQGDWIYTLIYMLGGETSTRIVNVLFIGIVGWIICSMACWAGGGRTGARVALLLYLATPLTYTESSSLFIESVWTAFLLAGVYSVLRLLADGKDADDQIPVAGILLGGAMAAKVLSLAMLMPLVALLLFGYRRVFQLRRARLIALGLAAFVVAGGVPYLNAWMSTGNPVFPFYNSLFQSSYYPATDFSPPPIFEKRLDAGSVYRMTFESGRFMEARPGASGFQWILLLLPSLAVIAAARNIRGLTIAFVAIACLAITFHQSAYLRYVFPSFAMFNVLIGVALSAIGDTGRAARYTGIVVAASAVALNVLHFTTGTHYGQIDLKAIVSESGRDRYIQRRLPVRSAVHLVNGLNTSRLPVAVYSSPLTAGLASDAIYFNWYNHEFQSLMSRAESPRDVVDVLSLRGVKYVIVNDAWGDSGIRDLIKASTDEIHRYGAISVRVVDVGLRYKMEVLKNGRFETGEAWHLHDGAELVGNGVLVSNRSPATQVVAVNQGQQYRLSVTSLCYNVPATGRLQVNWKAADSGFISADIQTFECSVEPQTHTVEVSSPPGATGAVIFATAHGTDPIIVNEISFRK